MAAGGPCVIRCKVCGTINEASVVFCGGCGNFLPDTGEPYDEAAEKAKAEAKTLTISPSRVMAFTPPTT